MAGVPTRYPVHTDVSEGAALALGLLDAEVIDEGDFVAGDDPASFIARSVKRLWLSEGLEDFGLTYTIATVDDQLYFLITLNEGHYLDFAPVAEVCDTVNDQLGPSLLTHLYAHTPLTPAFTPEACRELIAMSYWEGFDDADYLLEQARADLAQAHGVDEASLSDEEVESYADSHYFTSRRVDSLIDKRYQQPGRLSLETCRDLCSQHGFANLKHVCELLGTLEALGRNFPERSESFYEQFDGYMPYAVVIGVQHEGVEEDLVDEMFREYEQQVWQAGEYEPIYALEIDADKPGSLAALANVLEVGKRSLELTQKLYDTLEVTRCLFP
jgi:hypothetical protein